MSTAPSASAVTHPSAPGAVRVFIQDSLLDETRVNIHPLVSTRTLSLVYRREMRLSEPVTAVPSQPRIGERKAKNAPVAAIQVPIVRVWPDRFMT